MLNDVQLNSLYRYCLALTGDSNEAYELLHDGYEKIVRGTSESVSHPAAYFRTILRNLWFDQLRARKRYDEKLGALEQNVDPISIDHSSLEDVVVKEEIFDRVWQLLSSHDRELLYLWAVEGFTISEVAIEMDVPKGTLLSRVHRIRKRFQSDVLFSEYGVVK